jgi:hypothetical protein
MIRRVGLTSPHVWFPLLLGGPACGGAFFTPDNPGTRTRGTYTVTGLIPAMESPQRQYRIKYFSEEFERIARSNKSCRRNEASVLGAAA